MGVSGISTGFPVLSQSSGQVAHVLLTRSPLSRPRCCHRMDFARLACVKHAASVRPEPGSNSPSRSRANREVDQKSESRCCEVTEPRAPTGTERLCVFEKTRCPFSAFNFAITNDRPHWRFLAVSVPFSRCAGQESTRLIDGGALLSLVLEGCGRRPTLPRRQMYNSGTSGAFLPLRSLRRNFSTYHPGLALATLDPFVR
jgi:hypothetical protein